MHSTPQVEPLLVRPDQVPNLGSNQTAEVSKGCHVLVRASQMDLVEDAVLHLDLRSRRRRNSRLPARELAALSPSVMAHPPDDLAALVYNFIAAFPPTPVPLLYSRSIETQPQLVLLFHDFGTVGFVLPTFTFIAHFSLTFFIFTASVTLLFILPPFAYRMVNAADDKSLYENK